MGRIGGTLFAKVNGAQVKTKGSWTYNLGNPKREQVVGSDGVHGYKELPQVPYCDGIITDQPDLDVSALQNIVDGDIILELANGKTVAFRNACYAADGDVTTEEGEIQVRFEAEGAREL